MTEKQLVTTDAMSNFIAEFKNKIYDWDNPAGTNKESWTEEEAFINNKKYKLVPATIDDIMRIVNNI